MIRTVRRFLITPTAANLVGNKITDWFFLPSLWHTVMHRRVLISGEAEVNEPFLIQPLRRLLQQLDLLLVVFTEIIIG